MRAALVSLLVFAACASFPRVSTPSLLPPPGAEWLDAGSGQRLFSTLSGPADAGTTVWFVLGPEISSAPLYPSLTAALHEAGIATAVFHPRGAGYSDGLRGDTDDFEAVLADYRRFLDELARRAPGALFLFGHSAGAAFALEAAATTSVPLAGVVLVNPAFKLKAGEGMTPSFGDYLVFAGNMVFRPAALTVDMNSRPDAIAFAPDRDEGRALQADPLVVRYFSMRQLLAQKQVMDRCADNAARVTAPLLLIEGAHDALVDPTGNVELLARAKTRDKVRLVAPDGGHGSSAVESMVSELMEWITSRNQDLQGRGRK
ncbi:MAG: alpha/beta fold hydrolase [Myxococcaceae bacterium]|nr:alpha/beta fold hydrolase [Myxococcaceae bacterium]